MLNHTSITHSGKPLTFTVVFTQTSIVSINCKLPALSSDDDETEGWVLKLLKHINLDANLIKVHVIMVEVA